MYKHKLFSSLILHYMINTKDMCYILGLGK
jgi:hypothetical protein